MNFKTRYAKTKRLKQDNAVCKLIYSDNAPLIIGFLDSVFENESSVSVGKVRSALESELNDLRLSEELDSEKTPASYLRDWQKSGWLIDANDEYSTTEAFQAASRFFNQLDQKESSTTASHLKIVVQTAQDLATGISGTPEARLNFLEHKKDEIQSEIDDIKAGNYVAMSKEDKAEAVREFYQQATVLDRDFKKIEDEMRTLDHDIRSRIMKDGDNRGIILKALMNEEEALLSRSAGRAFVGFHQLLCDSDLSDEFRSLIQEILKDPDIQEELSRNEKNQLSNLMRLLVDRSIQIINVRRRTEDNLRGYIENGGFTEIQQVEKLLKRIEKQAIALKDLNINPREDTGLRLPIGKTELGSLIKWRLKMPGEEINAPAFEEVENNHTPAKKVLEHLDMVKTKELAAEMKALLKTHGPMTIKQLSKLRPMTMGIEELMCCIRIARATGAAKLPQKEQIIVKDRKGHQILAKADAFLMTETMFPEKITDLKL